MPTKLPPGIWTRLAGLCERGSQGEVAATGEAGEALGIVVITERLTVVVDGDEETQIVDSSDNGLSSLAPLQVAVVNMHFIRDDEGYGGGGSGGFQYFKPTFLTNPWRSLEEYYGLAPPGFAAPRDDTSVNMPCGAEVGEEEAEPVESSDDGDEEVPAGAAACTLAVEDPACLDIAVQ